MGVDVDGTFLIVDNCNHGQSCCHTGDQSGNGYACHSHVEHHHQKSVSCHIDDIHEHGCFHGNFGITHGTAESGAAIVDGQKRIGTGCDIEI